MAQYVFSMNRVGKIVPPKRHILKDISLSFFPGAKIGVLGTNGSGKSTLLKIMAGIDKEIEGEAIPMAGLKIGYLPQEPVMDPEQTVREAVESGMGEVKAAQARLEEVYAAYAEEDADFAKPGAPSPIEIRPSQFLRQAFFITLLNPKAILFYMAFFPLFVDPLRQQGVLTYGFMAATIAALTFLYGLAATLLSYYFAERVRASPKISQALEKLAGVVLIGFGVKLVVSQ